MSQQITPENQFGPVENEHRVIRTVTGLGSRSASSGSAEVSLPRITCIDGEYDDKSQDPPRPGYRAQPEDIVLVPIDSCGRPIGRKFGKKCGPKVIHNHSEKVINTVHEYDWQTEWARNKTCIVMDAPKPRLSRLIRASECMTAKKIISMAAIAGNIPRAQILSTTRVKGIVHWRTITAYLLWNMRAVEPCPSRQASQPGPLNHHTRYPEGE